MENLIFENTVVSIREITPANAARILDGKNKNNRNISKGKVDEYANSMRRGEWEFNGDSIRISSDGILLDGQHRLTALLKSNTAHHFIVIENMDSRVGTTIDTGKVRSGGDVLSIEAGVSTNKASAISGAIKLFNKHEAGKVLSQSGTGNLTNTQVLNEYRANIKLIDFCSSWVSDNVKGTGAVISKGEMIAILMIFCNINKDECIHFENMVFLGIGIVEKCPQSMLRDFLLDCRSGVRKSDSTQRLHTIIKVWNSIRSGRTIKLPRNIIFYRASDVFKKAI